MESPFMESMARLVAAHGIEVVRFEFPYMARMRREGRRRPPDPAARLLAAWSEVLDTLAGSAETPRRLLIGGKSLGGRIASLLAADRPVAGLVCLGYPFHPPAEPQRTRIAHLESLAVPTLICQGKRDPFGRPDEVSGYRLSPAVTLRWIPDGDHSFQPHRGSGRSWGQNLALAADAVAEWLKTLT
jgi:predicted alpha/beta-hydrolase family hydrolase